MGKRFKSVMALVLAFVMVFSLAESGRATRVQAAPVNNAESIGATVDEDGNLLIPYAELVMDGDIADWDLAGADSIEIGTENSALSDGFAGQTAKISYAWDETAIYALVKVYDTNISNTVSQLDYNTWQNVYDYSLADSVRFYFMPQGGQADAIMVANDNSYNLAGSNDRFYAAKGSLSDESGEGWFVELRCSLADAQDIFGHMAQNGDVLDFETVAVFAQPAASFWGSPVKQGKAAINTIDPLSAGSNPVSIKLVKDESITTIAEDIGRYDLIQYLNKVSATFGGNIPASVLDAYNAAKAEAASATATKESILAAMAALEAAVDALTKMNVQYAQIIVDGEAEAAWDQIPAKSFEITESDTQGQTATVKAAWDETAFYALVDVADPTFDVTGSGDHLKDSLEFFFIPQADAEANSYGSFGDQIRINRAGVVTTSHGSASHFYGVVNELTDEAGASIGYRAEVMWKFEHAADMFGHSEGAAVQNGDEIAFNVSANLAANGNRHGTIGLFTTDGYSNPVKCGTAKLEKDPSITTVAEETGRYDLIKVLVQVKADYTDRNGNIYVDIADEYEAAREVAYKAEVTEEEIQNALAVLNAKIETAKKRIEFAKYIESYIENVIAPIDALGVFENAEGAFENNYKETYEEAKEYAEIGSFTDEIAVRDAKIDAYIAALTEISSKVSLDNGFATDAEGRLLIKRGTPFVDGDASDPIWNDALTVVLTNEGGDKAVVKALWDDNAVYLLEDINDTVFDISGSDAHAKDSVEIFALSNADAALNSFGTYGGQWRLNRGNQITVTFGQNEPFYGRIKEKYEEDGEGNLVNTGYIAELRLEFLKDAKDAGLIVPGYTQHFDFSVNLYANGSKTGGLGFYGTDNYNNPKGTGSLVLIADECEGGEVPANYNPYALMKVVNKALEINPDDYVAEEIEKFYDREKLERYAAEAKAGVLSEEQINTYYDDVIDMMSKITYDGQHRSVLGFAATDFPDTFTFLDGSAVETEADWELRSEEIKDLYEFYMYGKLPDGSDEDVSFSCSDDGSNYTVTITRKSTGVTKSFDFKVDFPEGDAPEGGWPYIINYGGNISGAQDAGYAVVEYSGYGTVADTATVGKGIFYDLYPECNVNDYKNGVGHLAVRAWGAGLILDAIYDGTTGRLSELNPDNSAVTGFSFLGKTALVTGALEQRIAVTNPAHSGIGGAALIRWTSQGKNYTTEEYPLMEDGWLMTRQEPMGQVQGQGALWVKHIFSDFLGGDNLPFDTYMLASLVAPRGLFISAGYYDQGTDPEGMYGTYLGAQEVYKFLGAEGNIAFGDYPTQHANSTPETEDLFKFCDYYFYGKELPADFYQTIYDESPDKPQYDVISAPEKKTEEDPEDPVDPVDPVNPVDPVGPVNPVNPVDQIIILPMDSETSETPENPGSGETSDTGSDVSVDEPETPAGGEEKLEKVKIVGKKTLYEVGLKTPGSYKLVYMKKLPSSVEKITFKSSNKKVVKVNKYGRITAVKKGKATVTVTINYTDGTTETKKVKVTVKKLRPGL